MNLMRPLMICSTIIKIIEYLILKKLMLEMIVMKFYLLPMYILVCNCTLNVYLSLLRVYIRIKIG